MKLMKFSKDMYYNDLKKPLYLAGQVYEVDDKKVARWLKRGGEIVTPPAAVIPPTPVQTAAPPPAAVIPPTPVQTAAPPPAADASKDAGKGKDSKDGNSKKK